MENTKEIRKNKKHNIKVYPFYKMVSLDFIFYYAISFLFLNDFKGFSTSIILFTDAFYPFFKMVFQIPCTILIDKIGKRNSLVIGNVFLCLDILLMIGANSVLLLILSNLFFALGFILKGTIEHNILYDSLPKAKKRSKYFSRIEGISSAIFYILEAICAAITGFLYVINPYIPMFLCLMFCIIATILSAQFKHISYVHLEGNETDTDEDDEEIVLSPIERTKNYFKGLSNAFKFILKSRRLRSLILFNAFFASLILLLVNLRRSLLSDLEFTPQIFGIAFAIFGIISALTTAKTSAFHKKFRNKTLTYIGLIYISAVILTGLIPLLDIPDTVIITIVVVAIGIQYSLKGPYTTLIKQYLNNFSQSSMRIKIHSANILIECITSTIFTLFASFLLTITPTANVILIMGLIYLLLIVLTLDYMRTRVGLKPEEYRNSDINYRELS